jgi:hypothetical protein
MSSVMDPVKPILVLRPNRTEPEFTIGLQTTTPTPSNVTAFPSTTTADLIDKAEEDKIYGLEEDFH